MTEKEEVVASKDLDLFFADRVLRLDQEVAFFGKYLSCLRIDPAEIHGLNWRLKSINEELSRDRSQRDHKDYEILQFQKAIDEYQRELTLLKRSKEVRETQIKKLSELSIPVQHDTTYFITDRFSTRHSGADSTTDTPAPPYLIRVAKGSLKYNEDVENTKSEKFKSLRQCAKTGEVTKLERLVNSETAAAAALAQDLRLQLDHLEGDRLRSLVKEKETMREIFEQGSKLVSELHKVEMRCCLGVAEFLRLRLRMLIEQREEVEQLDGLQMDRENCKNKIQQMQQQLSDELSAVKTSLENEFVSSSGDFSRQLSTLNQQIKRLQRRESSSMAADSVSNQKEAALSSRLTASKERFNQLLRRHALELEGYHSEAIQLRLKLKHLETNVTARERWSRHKEQHALS